MPELNVMIGGRRFQVACQPGEEDFLNAAAKILDQEAQPLLKQLGRIPEAQMLLMAGLMLADRTAAVEEDLRKLKAKIAREKAEGRPDAGAPPESLTALVEEAEKLAARLKGAPAP